MVRKIRKRRGPVVWLFEVECLRCGEGFELEVAAKQIHGGGKAHFVRCVHCTERHWVCPEVKVAYGLDDPEAADGTEADE